MEQITRKHKLKEPAKLEIAEVTFVLNRAIQLCTPDYRSSNLVGSPVAGKALLAEYSMMEIFSGHDKVSSSFFFFLASSELYSHIANAHGVSVNGRIRRDGTRIMLNVTAWRFFTVRGLASAYAVFCEQGERRNRHGISSSSNNNNNNNISNSSNNSNSNENYGISAVSKQYDTPILKRILGRNKLLLMSLVRCALGTRLVDKQLKYHI